MGPGKVTSHQEDYETFSGQSVFELNLEEWEEYRCVRMKTGTAQGR